eukprot:scaffold18136_cov37-Prasinocladus_malaysianus.AAC.1
MSTSYKRAERLSSSGIILFLLVRMVNSAQNINGVRVSERMMVKAAFRVGNYTARDVPSLLNDWFFWEKLADARSGQPAVHCGRTSSTRADPRSLTVR